MFIRYFKNLFLWGKEIYNFLYLLWKRYQNFHSDHQLNGRLSLLLYKMINTKYILILENVIKQVNYLFIYIKKCISLERCEIHLSRDVRHELIIGTSKGWWWMVMNYNQWKSIMIQHKKQLSLLGSYFYVINIYYDRTQFTCLLSIIVFHMVQITYLLNAFKKERYEANQNSQL